MVEWAIQCGCDGRCAFTAVIDCHDRTIVGWRLADSGKAIHAASALEEAIFKRKTEIQKGQLVIRSDNGLVFGSTVFRQIINHYGLKQEYITPYSPEQNGMIERFFRSMKEECVWLHTFNSRDAAFSVISAWIEQYNHSRPHSQLNYLSPGEFRKLSRQKSESASCTLRAFVHDASPKSLRQKAVR